MVSERVTGYLVVRVVEGEESEQSDDLMREVPVFLPVTAVPEQVTGYVAQLQ